MVNITTKQHILMVTIIHNQTCKIHRTMLQYLELQMLKYIENIWCQIILNYATTFISKGNLRIRYIN